MKNLLESIAILLVGILSVAIIFFIVQYNLIEDDNVVEDITLAVPQKKASTAEKTKSYLDSLEGYGDDVDVKVDAKKESTVNEVVVKFEQKNDDIGSVVDDKSKSSYIENLTRYEEDSENDAQEETVKKAMEPVEKKVVQKDGEPETLPEDETADDIGKAINAALDDL